MGKVTVVLVKLTNLKDGDGLGKSDPYVKIELKKDGFGPMDKSYGDHESSHKNNTVNPEFNETFTWNTGSDDIGGLVLECTVMDEDIGLDDKVGKCKFLLADIEGSLSNFVAVQKKLDNKWFTKDAMVHLKVKWEG